MGLFSHDAADDVQVTATFPESNPFGLVVNGERNPLSITLQNLGKKNYTLVSAAASYHDPNNHWALIKNQTALKYNVPLVSGANFSAPFSMHSEFRPQEIGLTVWVNLAETGSKYTLPVYAFNQTVNVVEPASSWFDPQLIFLQLLITLALATGIYYAYNSYFAEPTKKSGGARKPRAKAVVPAEKGKQYPDVKPYEEEWIPAEHLKSRQSKLKKRSTGGGAASSGGEEVTSGGEITSGGEASGVEGKRGKKAKGKKA